MHYAVVVLPSDGTVRATSLVAKVCHAALHIAGFIDLFRQLRCVWVAYMDALVLT